MYSKAYMQIHDLEEPLNKEIIDLYTRSAKGGYALAQHELSNIAIGEERWDDAHEWAKKAQESELPIATYNRIRLFLIGHPSDDQTEQGVLQTLNQLAQEDRIEAKMLLAMLLTSGLLSMDVDIPRAKNLFRQILKQTDDDQQICHVARFYLERLGEVLDEETNYDQSDFTQEQQVVLEEFQEISVRETQEILKIVFDPKPTKTERKIARMVDQTSSPSKAFIKEETGSSRDSIPYPVLDLSPSDIKFLTKASKWQDNIKVKTLSPLFVIFVNHKLTLQSETLDASKWKVEYGPTIIGGHHVHGSKGNVIDNAALKKITDLVKDILNNQEIKL
jgi:hypothetical protein